MGDDQEWQRQLVSAALMAAVRAGMQYAMHPDARDEALSDVKSQLANVDYGGAAKAVSEVIDRVAESAKTALNDAIDSIRENAEGAVEAAAEKAQEQLGAPRRKGKGRMFLGILLGIALGFVLLNEERRNQLMDKVTGASGPVDSSQWSTVASKAQTAATSAAETVTAAATDAVAEATESPEAAVEANGSASAAAPAADNGSEPKPKKSKGETSKTAGDA